MSQKILNHTPFILAYLMEWVGQNINKRLFYSNKSSDLREPLNLLLRVLLEALELVPSSDFLLGNKIRAF